MTKKNDNFIKTPIEDAKYYLLSLQYTDDNGKTTTGNVRVINNKFVFEGNVEKSANVFFNVTLKKLVDDYLKVRAEYTEKPPIKRIKEECYLDYYGKPAIVCGVDEFGETDYKSLDSSTCHINANEVLVDFLNDLGYKRLTEEYEKVRKWYD